VSEPPMIDPASMEPALATVMCVCTGNICRSAAMEAYLARAWVDAATVTSAGTMAAAGWHSPAPMLAVMKSVGLDGSKHVARQLEMADVESSDLVLVATHLHLAWIARHFGAAPPNTFVLTEAAELTKRARRPAGNDRIDRIRTAAALLDAARAEQPAEYQDVHDPYGHGDDAYHHAMDIIVGACTSIVEWVG
jgi:protein-tyrosine phosphatase